MELQADQRPLVFWSGPINTKTKRESITPSLFCINYTVLVNWQLNELMPLFPTTLYTTAQGQK